MKSDQKYKTAIISGSSDFNCSFSSNQSYINHKLTHLKINLFALLEIYEKGI